MSTLSPFQIAMQTLEGDHPPERIDLGLHRITRVVENLDCMQRIPPVIHVAGTNGKGSTIAFLRTLLEQHGKSVHVFTSPHLVSYCERFVVAGRQATEDAVLDAIARIKAAEGGNQLTMFELLTATAFVLFADVPADFCLIETGLGGRLDSTNCLPNKLCAILTPIALDHSEFLGDTIDAIAKEKAAILDRAEVAFTADQHPAAMSIITGVAEQTSTPLYAERRDWQLELPAAASVAGAQKATLAAAPSPTWQVSISPDRQDNAGVAAYRLPTPTLRGQHQCQNAALALAVAAFLLPMLDPDRVTQAMVGAHWPARLQRLSFDGNAFWLDGAHNAHGAAQVIKYFAPSAHTPQQPAQPAKARLAVVVALGSNKPIAPFLQELATYAELLVAIPMPTFAGHSPAALCAAAEECGMSTLVATDWHQGLLIASQMAQEVLIIGSLYLAGEVLKDCH
ncbi:MAG: bifunctional folylpolyglutamate synthase/dihydrofolate synthase [Alphaproteobacteria bacterium]|nr:bifunctional folylpolyglutamate synthase/dihydrofolate synthase [Alphaproteobacteria bacterium]